MSQSEQQQWTHNKTVMFDAKWVHAVHFRPVVRNRPGKPDRWHPTSTTEAAAWDAYWNLGYS